ncbi:hypothetical protein TNCV_3258901 [Trichonephila clavipes]|nr:hypothetical protein TNCV_3258901 [Trichonephila clavipes]
MNRKLFHFERFPRPRNVSPSEKEEDERGPMPTSSIKDLLKKWEDVRAMVLELHPNQTDVSRALSFGRPDCKNSPQSHIMKVYDAGLDESGVFHSAEWHVGDWSSDGIREAWLMFFIWVESFKSFLAWLRAKRLLSDWMQGTVNIDSNWLPWELIG